MGAIKDQAGVLVGFNLTRQDIIDDIGGTGLQDNANPKEYLEAWLPNGLTGEQNSPGGVATKGKIVTFSENETDDKEFYAFNYNSGSPGKWIYLGKIADSGMRDAKLCLTRATEDDIKKVRCHSFLLGCELQRMVVGYEDSATKRAVQRRPAHTDNSAIWIYLRPYRYPNPAQLAYRPMGKRILSR